MHVRWIKTAPTMVARRKDHLNTGSGGPPSAPCHEPGDRKRLRVKTVNPPIQNGGNMNFR
jgi:hypothetical protein